MMRRAGKEAVAVAVRRPKPAIVPTGPSSLPQWEFWTPAMAATVISTSLNPRNRKVSPVAVKSYRRDMDADGWVTNGETIAFGPDGLLGNGEHRIRALAGAKTAGIWLLIARGVDARNYDRGRTRSAADDFRMSGLHRSQRYVAAVKVVSGLADAGAFMKMERYSQHDILRVEDEWPAACGWLKEIIGTGPSRPFTAAVLGALAFALASAPGDIRRFWLELTHVVTGGPIARAYLRQWTKRREMRTSAGVAGGSTGKHDIMLVLHAARFYIAEPEWNGSYLKASDESVEWWRRRAVEL